MGRELPCVRHLVKDQPAPQVLTGQLGLSTPLLDIGLDQVQALGADRLRAQELRIVLAQDPLAEEPEHEPDITIEARATDLDKQRIRDSTLFENRVDDPLQDAQVEVEPALAIDCLEPRQLGAGGEAADEVEQWLFELGGHGAVALLGRRQRTRGDRFLAKASASLVPDFDPIDQNGRATAGAHRLGHGDRSQSGDDAEERRPTDLPPHISRLRDQPKPLDAARSANRCKASSGCA